MEDADGCSEFDDDEHRQDPFADDVGGMIEEEGDKGADEGTGESAGPMEAHEYALFSWPWRPANMIPKDKRGGGADGELGFSVTGRFPLCGDVRAADSRIWITG